MPPDDWLMSALAARDAYRGDYPWPAGEDRGPLLPPPANPARMSGLEEAVLPHLSDPRTYRPLPPPDVGETPGKIPQVESDPRMMGAIADIGNAAYNALPFGGPVAGGAKVAAPLLAAGLRRGILTGAKDVGEAITGISVKFDGQFYHGASHLDAVENAAKATGRPLDEVIRKRIDGFTTSSGDFVDRNQGMILAGQSGQLKPGRGEWGTINREDINIQPQPEGIRGYHSSPHDFERFDLSKVGTGQGAQSYSHGIYIGENPAVSGQGGQYWNEFLGRFSEPERAAASVLQNRGFDREKAIGDVRSYLASGHLEPAERANVEASLRLLESGKPVGPRTYETLTKAQPEEFLYWDRPLKQQAVAEKLPSWFLEDTRREAYNRALGATSPERADKLWMMSKDPLEAPGEFGIASSKYMRGADTAARLNEAGIPGVRYLDQGSRRAVELQKIIDQSISPDRVRLARQELEQLKPTYIHTVFDPKNRLEILRKYGLAGAIPAAGAMGDLARTDTYQ
jgi:hypothetical protein